MEDMEWAVWVVWVVWVVCMVVVCMEEEWVSIDLEDKVEMLNSNKHLNTLIVLVI